MLYQLRRLLGLPFNLLHARLAPESYARRIGVNVQGSLKIYGSAYAMFNSEPFLITLGDNVYISVGANFVNHDGVCCRSGVVTLIWISLPRSWWATTSSSAWEQPF